MCAGGGCVTIINYLPPFRNASSIASWLASSKSHAWTYLYTPTSAFFSASYDDEYSIFCLILADSGHQVISTRRSTDIDVFSCEPSTGMHAGKSNTQYRQSDLNFCNCSRKSAYDASRGPVDSTSITCGRVRKECGAISGLRAGRVTRHLLVLNVIDDVAELLVLLDVLVHGFRLGSDCDTRRLHGGRGSERVNESDKQWRASPQIGSGSNAGMRPRDRPSSGRTYHVRS